MCIFFGKTKQVVANGEGFSVKLAISESTNDSMFQEILHPAIFLCQEDAESFLKRVCDNLAKVNLNNWIIGNHPCDAWQRKPEENPAVYVLQKMKY